MFLFLIIINDNNFFFSILKCFGNILSATSSVKESIIRSVGKFLSNRLPISYTFSICFSLLVVILQNDVCLSFKHSFKFLIENKFFGNKSGKGYYEKTKEKDENIRLVGVEGTKNILDAISNKCKIVFPSTHVVYEGINSVKKNIVEDEPTQPILSYSTSKAKNEKQLKSSGKNCWI